MFVANARGGYTRDGQQRSKGDFLIVVGDPSRTVEIGGEVCRYCGTYRDHLTEGAGPKAACERHPVYAEWVGQYIQEHNDTPPRDAAYAEARGWAHEWRPRTALGLLACVRSVSLTQFGHFMMGVAHVGPERITLSGPYGADGLPYAFSPPAGRGAEYGEYIPEGVRPYLHPVPPGLCVAFWAGGGHNQAGAEGPAMRTWARQNLKTLKGRQKEAV